MTGGFDSKKDLIWFLILVAGLLVGGFACADTADELLPLIILAESSGREQAVSPDGGYGLCQITAPLLTDYNRVNKTAYTLNDMLSADLNKKVALWYLRWLNSYLTKYGYPNDSLRILVCYNWGVGNLKRNDFRVPDWFMRHPNKVYMSFYKYELMRRKSLP